VQYVFHLLAVEFQPLFQQVDGVEVSGKTSPVVEDLEVKGVESELDLAAE